MSHCSGDLSNDLDDVPELTVPCKVKGQTVLPFENRAGGLEDVT